MSIQLIGNQYNISNEDIDLKGICDIKMIRAQGVQIHSKLTHLKIVFKIHCITVYDSTLFSFSLYSIYLLLTLRLPSLYTPVAISLQSLPTLYTLYILFALHDQLIKEKRNVAGMVRKIILKKIFTFLFLKVFRPT